MSANNAMEYIKVAMLDDAIYLLTYYGMFLGKLTGRVSDLERVQLAAQRCAPSWRRRPRRWTIWSSCMLLLLGAGAGEARPGSASSLPTIPTTLYWSRTTRARICERRRRSPLMAVGSAGEDNNDEESNASMAELARRKNHRR